VQAEDRVDLRVQEHALLDHHLRATLRANPSHIGAHTLLGRYLEQKGQPEQALGEYEAALRVNPNLNDVKLRMGVLYARTDRLPEALRLARELEKSDPKSPTPPVLRGTVLLAQHNPQGAIEAFNAALSITDEETAASSLSELRRKPYPSLAPLAKMQTVISIHDPRVLNVSVVELIDDQFVRKFDEDGELDALYAAYR
jgi:cytochrome c-type biogenesis protein CcmH/NrfG